MALLRGKLHGVSGRSPPLALGRSTVPVAAIATEIQGGPRDDRLNPGWRLVEPIELRLSWTDFPAPESGSLSRCDNGTKTSGFVSGIDAGNASIRQDDLASDPER